MMRVILAALLASFISPVVLLTGAIGPVVEMPKGYEQSDAGVQPSIDTLMPDIAAGRQKAETEKKIVEVKATEMTAKMTEAIQEVCKDLKPVKGVVYDCKNLSFKLKRVYMASVSKPGEVAIIILQQGNGEETALMMLKTATGAWALAPEDFI